LINLPLTVKEIQAVVFFKENATNDWRISLRSKAEVDINAVAKQFGGGGHKNASGCSAEGPIDELKALFREKIIEQIDKADASGAA
jgi:phosphoesterase RecJ-like protein